MRALWPGATVAGLADGPALAFAAGGRGDLRGALLLLALVCALAETLLVGRVGRGVRELALAAGARGWVAGGCFAGDIQFPIVQSAVPREEQPLAPSR